MQFFESDIRTYLISSRKCLPLMQMDINTPIDEWHFLIYVWYSSANSHNNAA